MTPEIGQTVYMTPILWGGDLSQIGEGTLVRIGRKYYTVKRFFWEYRFDKETLQENTNMQDRLLYLSKQAVVDKAEQIRLTGQLLAALDMFSAVKLSLDQLRRINAILEEPA